MSDFDPYAYVQQDSATPSDFDPYGYVASDAKSPSDASTSSLDAPDFVTQALHTAVAGAGQNIGATGAVIKGLAQGKISSIADADAAAQQYKASHPSYQPETEGGRTASEVLSSDINPLNWPFKAAEYGGKGITWGLDQLGVPSQYSTVLGPLAEAGADTAMGAEGAVKSLGVGASPAGTLESAQSALNTRASSQSMGSAGAAPDLSKLGPDLQKAVVQAASKTGGAVNMDVLNKQAEADSLPVPMRLTEGQALRDPTKFSDELNNRAQNSEMPKFLNDQHDKLVQNLQAIRDQAGPEVFSSNPTEHGDSLIQAYKDRDAPVVADISAKYKALRDANGGQFPIDAGQLYSNVSKELHGQLLYDDAPKAVMSTLGRLSDQGNMTFENFESLRSNLARIQRDPNVEGNTKFAAGIIRNQMEDFPLSGGAANLKPLADTARAAAKSRFDTIEADPAYKAVVNGDATPDSFVKKYVVNGNRDDVATMRQNLTGNDTALQTMGVAAIDNLKSGAKIDWQGNGRFTQAGFNKNLNALGPKLQYLVDPKTANDLQSLGNVARNIQERPPGAYVNESNTFVAGAKHALGSAAETGGNLLLPGVGLGTKAAKAIEATRAARQVKAATAPGAGLQSLSDLIK